MGGTADLLQGLGLGGPSLNGKVTGSELDLITFANGKTEAAIVAEALLQKYDDDYSRDKILRTFSMKKWRIDNPTTPASEYIQATHPEAGLPVNIGVLQMGVDWFGATGPGQLAAKAARRLELVTEKEYADYRRRMNLPEEEDPSIWDIIIIVCVLGAAGLAIFFGVRSLFK